MRSLPVGSTPLIITFLILRLKCSLIRHAHRHGRVGALIGYAQHAVASARRLRLPAGVALFKDIEQAGACHGQLNRHYILAWYRRVRRSPYRAAFYGNSTAQSYDFPRAFCAAARHAPSFVAHIVLAQDEPEPDIGAASGSIGPSNAPPYAPKHPSCTTRAATAIWQYGESIGDDNLTDVDQIRPGTPGLLAPNGSVTRQPFR